MNALDAYKVALQRVAEGGTTAAYEDAKAAVLNDPRLISLDKLSIVDDILVDRYQVAASVDHPWAALRLGVFHAWKRNPGEALQYFSRAAELSGADAPFGDEHLWRVAKNAELVSQLEAAGETEIAGVRKFVGRHRDSLAGENWFDLSDAAIRFIDGRTDEATDLLCAAQESGPLQLHELMKSQRALHSVLPRREADYEDLLGADSPGLPLKLDAPHRRNGPVHLCAADSSYFHKFASTFAHFAAAHSYPYVVHLHVVNPTDESFTLAATLRQNYPNLLLNFSYSTYTKRLNSRAYFATCRFIIAPTLAELYHSDLIISDIDVRIVGDVSDLLARMETYDVGVRVRPSRSYFPWKRVVVNLVFLKNTQKSIELLKYVSHYFHRVMAKKSSMPLWGIDQSAFCYALHYGHRESVAVTDLNIDQVRYIQFAGNDKVGWSKKIMAESTSK